MANEHEKWWINPRSSAFWLVYGQAIAIILLIVSGLRPIVIVTSSESQLSSEQIEDALTSNSDSLSKPKLLDNIKRPIDLLVILHKYPPVQEEEIFEKYYKGNLVTWKGTVTTAFKQDMYDSVHYTVGLIDADSITFGARFDNQWKNRISILERGETLTVQGQLDRPLGLMYVLKHCTILDE